MLFKIFLCNPYSCVRIQFLLTELAKYESWEDVTSNNSIKGLFDTQRAFETTKGMGVGQTTILKFLGGNWKQHMIQIVAVMALIFALALSFFVTGILARFPFVTLPPVY